MKAAVRVQDIFTYAKLICIAILTFIGLIELGKGMYIDLTLILNYAVKLQELSRSITSLKI